jgi:hypothetical protein
MPSLDDLGTKQVVSGTPDPEDIIPYFDISEFGNAPVKKTTVSALLAGAGGGSTDTITTSDGSAAAAAGKLGEYAETVVVAPVSLSNDNTANIASLALTAGDWDVSGFVQFGATGATTSYRSAALSTISAAIGGDAIENGIPTSVLGFSETIVTPPTRFLLAAPTTIYLVATVGITVGTIGATGTVTARRVR